MRGQRSILSAFLVIASAWTVVPPPVSANRQPPRRATQSWSPVLRLSLGPGASAGTVAAGGRSAIALWNGLRTRRSGPSGQWGPIQRLPHGAYASVAMNGSGQAVAVWRDSKGEGELIHVSSAGTRGPWGPRSTIVASRDRDRTLVENLSVAVADNGSAAVAWITAPDEHAFDFPDPSVLRVVYRSPGGSWGRPEVVSQASQALRQASNVVVGADGRVHVAFTDTSGMYVRTRAESGRWGARVRVAGTRGLNLAEVQPRLALARNGRNAVLAWAPARRRGYLARRITAVHRVGGAWGRAQKVAGRAPAVGWDLAWSGQRRVEIAWTNRRGVVTVASWRPLVGTLTHTPIAQLGPRQRYTSVDLAANPRGDLALTWTAPGTPRNLSHVEVADRPHGHGWSQVHRVPGRPQGDPIRVSPSAATVGSTWCGCTSQQTARASASGTPGSTPDRRLTAAAAPLRGTLVGVVGLRGWAELTRPRFGQPGDRGAGRPAAPATQ